MIFNRTQNDVDTAIRLRREKVQTFKELTEEEKQTLEKGTITHNTLNRIQSKLAELKNLLNDIGYWNTPISNLRTIKYGAEVYGAFKYKTQKMWNNKEIFYINDFMRMINDENILREAFFVYDDTPNAPTASYDWQNINALEKILYDIDAMIKDVKSHYRECGIFECGEE